MYLYVYINRKQHKKSLKTWYIVPNSNILQLLYLLMSASKSPHFCTTKYINTKSENTKQQITKT